MKLLLLPGLLLLAVVACSPAKRSAANRQDEQSYRYQVNLRHVVQDSLAVTLTTPTITDKEAIFVIPRIVPGIYGAMNFGQYVGNFNAFSRDGTLLTVARNDTNSWRIERADQLSRITYRVADTWDRFKYSSNSPANFYRSAGSCYQADSAFVFNYNTFVGYLEGHEKVPYQIQFTKPAGFYGASSQPPTAINDSTEVVAASTYHDLVDAPLLYARPDTAWIHLGSTKVLVALYSEEKGAYAATLAKTLRTILEKQRAYLGGTLPVKQYSFLVYYATAPRGNFMGDGLEHNNSTLCLLASHSLSDLDNYVTSIASHEFFHIVTPLGVHAREIEEYDYRRPVLSQHLWLYEGMTEYMTIHMPIKEKLEPLSKFVAVVQEKIQQMNQFDNTASFTELSRNAITRQDQYYNFYLKGALINLCLDIRLRELSGGKMGTQELMQKLLAKYGVHKPFDDNQLFDVIAQLTYPEIGQFLRDYVAGTKLLPLQEYLTKAGLDYNPLTGKITVQNTLSPQQAALRQAWIGL